MYCGLPPFGEGRPPLRRHGDLPVLDDPKKTDQLIAELKAAVPFTVELTPRLLTHLRAEHADIADASEHLVRDLSYAGDEGGIVCHLAATEAGAALVVSLTHLLVPRSLPFAADVRQYQKHRVKKLKKQDQR
jgi:hypothetical protein